MKEGLYTISLIITDDDDDSSKAEFELEIKAQREGEIVVTHAINKFNGISPVFKMRLGELPNFNAHNDELNFSNLSKFEELTLIQTDVRDIENTDKDYLSFVVNADATVFVGYEKYDKKYISSIPEWLQSWEKLKRQKLLFSIAIMMCTGRIFRREK